MHKITPETETAFAAAREAMRSTNGVANDVPVHPAVAQYERRAAMVAQLKAANNEPK